MQLWESTNKTASEVKQELGITPGLLGRWKRKLKNESEPAFPAIRRVAAGGAIFSPGIAQKVLGYLTAPTPDVPENTFDELTAREREILEIIAQGKTNAEIATILSLSPKTVSTYISNVLLKLHTTDRAKLMLMALEAGLGQTDNRSS